jgi:type III secretion system low calcium response chaperone LcrH/SycD
MSEEMVDVSEISEEQLQDILQGIMTGETTLQEVKGFTDEQMEAVYTVAYNLYQAQKHQDAAEVFTFLSMFNPFNSKYWMGLGASLQMAKDFDNALNAYAVAAVTSIPKDPVPHLHAGECNLGKGDVDEALKGFEMAMDFSEGREEFTSIHEKAKAFCEILKDKSKG